MYTIRYTSLILQVLRGIKKYYYDYVYYYAYIYCNYVVTGYAIYP